MQRVLVNFVIVFAATLAGLMIYSTVAGRKDPVPPLQQVQDFGVGQIRARRDALTDGLRAADGAKTAFAEYYSNTGKLPTGNADVGLPEPDAFRGKAVRSIAVSEQGITVTYDASSGLAVGSVLFEAQADAGSGSVTWRCSSSSYREIKMLVPMCEYRGPSP